MGRTHATEVVAARAGTELDPKLAAIARELPPTDIDASLAAMEALFSARSLPLTLEAIVEAFAEFSDLQIPHKLGHGREVGLLASAAAEALGLPPIDRRDVEWAARLHDVGQVAIPTGSWCSSRARRPSETARQQTHAAIGERVFATCGSLARVGSLVGTHHERLDGSGYPRARTALALARGARIVAAADVWSALRAERPWRAAMSVAAAARVMGQEVSAGRLDGAVVEAILAHAGVVRSRWANAASTSIGAVSLSERERQVLAVLARGATNKEIAQRLGISARTVQHHTLHIYEKLGVSTRAGAATAASRLGLLGLDAEG
jgi:HD-GYP domain-containing protein (c-di-GMP phosphodiesterase class II)